MQEDYLVDIFIFNIDIKMFVMFIKKTMVFVYVLMVFPKVKKEGTNVKILKKLRGSSELATYMDGTMLKPSKLKNWLPLNAKLTIASYNHFMGVIECKHDSLEFAMWRQFNIIGSPQTSSHYEHRDN